MIKLEIEHTPTVLVPETVEELHLDAPLGWYRNLGEALKALKSLRTLRIKIHFRKYHASGLWKYGRLDPYPSLNFLASAESLEALELEYLHKLSEGDILRTLPKLSSVIIGYKTRFDLLWLNPLKIHRISLGLTKSVLHQELLSEMENLRRLGVDNVKGPDLSILRRMEKLTLLGIGGAVDSLYGIGGAKVLHTLNINTLRFTDYGDFHLLKNLQILQVQSCYHFKSLEPLRARNLRELIIYGTKTRIQNLQSVKPLTRCPSLEKFVFGGIIDDDDIRPLLELPNLKDCLLNPRYRAMIDVVEKDPVRRKIFRL